MTTTVSQEAREARIEHLRAEIRRCDLAIEQGTADNWWHIDRDRFRQELDDLTEPRHRQSAERGEVERMIPAKIVFDELHAFGSMPPEDGESWESWFHAAFDMVAARIDERTLPTPPEAVRTPIEGTSHAD